MTDEPQSVKITDVQYFYNAQDDKFTLPIINTGDPTVTIKQIILTYKDFPYEARVDIDHQKYRVVNARAGEP